VQGLSFQNREPDLMILLRMTHCRGVRPGGFVGAPPGCDCWGPTWLKFKNPDAPAVKCEFEEEWGNTRRR
jgi:hypothetical protein